MIKADSNISSDSLVIRLESFIKKVKRLGVDIESVSGMNKQSRLNYRKRGNIPKSSTLLEWSTEFDLSVDWLLTGEGDMLRAGLTPAAHGEDQRVRELEERVRLLQELLDAKDKIIAMYEEKGEGRKSVGIDARTGPPVVRS